jgi:hypothetical protein
MPLPEKIRVKLSSETAESISLTPVVVQELPIRELVEHMLGVTGKDEPRIREMLLRGTLVSGASRFRWTGWEAEADGLRALLATFPDAEPDRPLRASNCIRAVLRGGRQTVDLPREPLMRKSLFQHSTFWDAFLQVVEEARCEYAGYSYRDRADRYLREFSLTEADRVRQAAEKVKFSTLRDRIATVGFTGAELFAAR